MKTKVLLFILALIAVIFLFPERSVASNRLPLIFLGSYGGNINMATDINNLDEVVGTSRDVSGNFDHAFIWENGVMTDLGTLGGIGSSAIRINEKGQVLGHSWLPDGNKRAFLWENEVMIDLGHIGGNNSNAIDLNNNGWVVGYGPNSPYSDGDYHAFLWRDGVMTELGFFGEEEYVSYAIDINEVGQILGVGTSANLGARVFIWENGVMTDLALPNPNSIQVVQINDLGQVVGQAFGHAFFWEDGTMTDLGALDAENSWAVGINNQGQVTGHFQYENLEVHPFFWENGTMIDLGLLSNVSTLAVDINENGQVIGSSYEVANREAGFLWDEGVLYSLGLRSFPLAINDKGNIAGYVIQRGIQYAVIWKTTR